MIDGFSFVHNVVLIPVFIGALVLFAIYLYKEWVNKSRGSFALNAIVAFVTIAAVVLLVLESVEL